MNKYIGNYYKSAEQVYTIKNKVYKTRTESVTQTVAGAFLYFLYSMKYNTISYRFGLAIERAIMHV